MGALFALQGCLAPGDIDDPEAFLARIGRGEGGVIDRDGAVGAGGSSGSGASAGSGGSASNACDGVVTELLTSCQAMVCHGDDSSSPLKLEGAGLPDRLVGQKSSATCMERPYIDPQSPEDSLILAKLTAKPPCGSPMPLGGKTPTEAQRTCVLEWIKGATGSATPGMDAGTKMDAGTDAGKTDAGNDMCPSDPLKTAPGKCGCGMPDDDSDDDGTPDCMEDEVPGLLVGTLSGNPNYDDPNPGNMGVDPLGPSKSEATDWPGDSTLVFSGKIRITDSGVASFYEDIDDGVRLIIDGTMVLNNGVWDEPSTGTIERAPGWYDFELRLSNGTGDSGPSMKMGLGFGYAPVDRMGSMNEADYEHPSNSSATKGDLFVTEKP